MNTKQAKGENASITVSKTVFNQLTEEKEMIQIRPFATETAHVGVKIGRTINLGNYESARIDVLIDVPCYVEECKTVYNDVLKMAEDRLSEEVSRIASIMSASGSSVEELL